jgi:hypothetical protein
MGLTLQLLPMLLGFFTYKGAVLAKQSLVLFAELAGGQRQHELGGVEHLHGPDCGQSPPPLSSAGNYLLHCSK